MLQLLCNHPVITKFKQRRQTKQDEGETHLPSCNATKKQKEDIKKSRQKTDKSIESAMYTLSKN